MGAQGGCGPSVEQALLRQGLTRSERAQHACLIEECATREKEIDEVRERVAGETREGEGAPGLVEEVTALKERAAELVKNETEQVRKAREAARDLADFLGSAYLRFLPGDRFRRE